ncbi:substrate-binding domain-containing protein [Jidongwangia harbinensis]|uniref:substrate-binding domain-containing protein n=1 Tax=Jidongwangia harbinensis TaxID=2878561 RepID=UPI001CD9D632|nr:substrate-binding domain-containing protein [Jidongwangia harbinensis]MCA2211383.1 substrate-binding and VWA domain-containing protein [Jidongwangia harbinensis]
MSGREIVLAGNRRHPNRLGRRAAVAAGILVCVGAGVAAGGIWRADAQARDDHRCAPGARPLHVAAAPEIAGVVADLAGAAGSDDSAGGCPRPVVTAVPAVEVADVIRNERGDRPDVWIPDSSVWVNRRAPAGRALPPNNPSVARSPIVVAVAERTAAGLGWPSRTPELGDLLVPDDGDAAGPVRFVLPDPGRSAATVGVLLGMQSDVAGDRDGRATLARVLRAATRGSERADQLLTSLRPRPRLAAPATEQQVWSHNAEHPQSRVVAAYQPGPGHAFDYPYVVLSNEESQRRQAERLRAVLTGEIGRWRLLAAGFRDPLGRAGADLATDPAVAPARPATGPAPDAERIDDATRALRSLTLGSRLLVVLDVSGSMATPVPGANGRTRLAVALEVLMNGLALYPDGARVGLWTFATNLDGKRDHREEVPTVALGRNDDGTVGRERLARAFGGVTAVRGGGTALYDTALAAVRAVRRDWDPTRANSVVLLSDGRNDDRHGIGLDRLVDSLRAEHDPARPVRLTTIAYGPDSDRAALSTMSRATGGEMYSAPTPLRVREVILDAIGRRACRPDC